MKKTTRFIAILILTLLLTACNNGTESTRTFELEENGVITTVEYTFEGDKVTKQTAENIIPYDSVGINSKEEAQEIFAPMSEEFQNFDGLTHKMEYDNSKAIESLIINYEVVNFEEIQHLPGMNFDEDVKTEGVSMKKSAEFLESQGFTEIT